MEGLKLKDYYTNESLIKPTQVIKKYFGRLLSRRYGSAPDPVCHVNEFIHNNDEKLNLYIAVDNIKDRFGKTSLKKRQQRGIKPKSLNRPILLIFAG